MALSIFTPVPVVHEVCREGELPASTASFAWHTMTLGWEDRLKARARRVSDDGLEFATALPRGTVLAEGDCLLVDARQMIVRVVERRESVFVIRPRDAAETARFAYQIGNSHQPLMIVDGTLICVDAPGMLQVLDYHAIPYERVTRSFTPLSQAPGHQHGLPR